jgi:DMSO/TMAO reductase YedYZ molybdopterin-dependent catalytic subunit
MDRRRFVLQASGTMAAAMLLPGRGSAADPTLPAGAVASEVMDALPGKRPLIKRSFRPPNYETPLALLREPLTPNDAFYVRWHMGVPDVTAADWRLRIAGPAAKTPREFTLAELRKFEPHEVVAINQCSGNRRGLFDPHVPGVQWSYGAMGNAAWRGVRLKDVLEAAGIAGSAVEVLANGADSPTLTGPDFAKSLPMPKALDADTLIAFEMNGEPLSRWHGHPARLVVPGWTATYWVKCLTELSILDKPFDGFWMKTAYRVPRNLFGPSGFDTQDNEQTSPITAIKINSLVIRSGDWNDSSARTADGNFRLCLGRRIRNSPGRGLDGCWRQLARGPASTQPRPLRLDTLAIRIDVAGVRHRIASRASDSQ